MRYGNVALIMLGLLVVSAGCQSRMAGAGSGASGHWPDAAARAEMRLDEITPVPKLPAGKVVNTEPPLEALLCYVQAREKLGDGKRLEGIAFLEQAAALDPESFLLHIELARVYLGTATFEPHSIAELEKAAAIEPDHLDVQLDLGRQLLASGADAKGFEHLRLATQTTQYKVEDPHDTEVELFLAHALQQLGFDRAALTEYERLLTRLAQQREGHALDPDMAMQISDRLYEQIGDLYLKRNDADSALKAYRSAVRAAEEGHDTQDAALRGRIVRILLATGRPGEAANEASEAVRRCHASPETVTLLRDAATAAGRKGGAVAELARLHAENPVDRPILFALAGLLRADHHDADAERILSNAATTDPFDGRVLRTRAEFRIADGDFTGAARLLIDSTARRPALCSQVMDLWDRLLQPADPIVRLRLPLSALQALSVGRDAEASRYFAVYIYASRWPRRQLALAALGAAIHSKAIFPPAYRERLDQIWRDTSRTRAWQVEQSDALVETAREAGDPSLAAELQGRAALARGDVTAAAAAISDAVRLAPKPGSGQFPDTGADPQIQLALAHVMHNSDDAGYEKLLRQIVWACPGFDAAWQELHDYLWTKDQGAAAEAIAAQWRENDAAGLAVRLTQVRDQLRLGRTHAADVLLAGLLDQYPDDPRVLNARMESAGSDEQFIRLLNGMLMREPMAIHAVAMLATVESARGHQPEAVAALDALRQRASDEPDLLYDLSQEYRRLGRDVTADDVLQQVLRLDPSHPEAGNDLAHDWAEQGKNLARAEQLTRQAVDAVPGNVALLDRLGWVLYKEGRFQEARAALVKAAGDETLAGGAASGTTSGQSGEDPGGGQHPPDPVLLDHLGDCLYRLHEIEAAGRVWQRCSSMLADIGGETVMAPPVARSTLSSLRQRLQSKQQQLRAGQAVDVAPVADPR